MNNDADTERYKGKTVMDHKTRCMSVANCKWVDAVAEDAPWIITDEFIKKYNIDFVAHDAIPYTDTTGTASNSNDIYGHIKVWKRSGLLESFLCAFFLFVCVCVLFVCLFVFSGERNVLGNKEDRWNFDK